MTMQWFRFYNGAVDDPKLRALSDQLFRLWVDLLCVASENEPRGQLPPVAVISLRLRRRLDHVQGGLKRLIKGGLIDGSVGGSVGGLDGPLVIHNWGRFQYKSDDVTSRVKRFRNAGRNGFETPRARADYRLQTTETETETDPARPSVDDGQGANAVSTDGLTDGQSDTKNLSSSGRMLAQWIERYVPRTASGNAILGEPVGDGTFVGAERVIRRYGAGRVLAVIREMSEERWLRDSYEPCWRPGIKSPAEYLAWYLRETYG